MNAHAGKAGGQMATTLRVRGPYSPPAGTPGKVCHVLSSGGGARLFVLPLFCVRATETPACHICKVFVNFNE